MKTNVYFDLKMKSKKCSFESNMIAVGYLFSLSKINESNLCTLLKIKDTEPWLGE